VTGGFLRIVFPAPGFFIGDTTVALLVNGAHVFTGSFTRGFDWWAPLPPGRHVVATTIAAPLGISRSKTYSLDVRPGLATIAVLDYSRLWGNFESNPVRVDFVPA
jgi:hypothetical protein